MRARTIAQPVLDIKIRHTGADFVVEFRYPLWTSDVAATPSVTVGTIQEFEARLLSVGGKRIAQTFQVGSEREIGSGWILGKAVWIYSPNTLATGARRGGVHGPS